VDIAKWEKLDGVTTVISKGIGKMNALNVRETYKRVAGEDIWPLSGWQVSKPEYRTGKLIQEDQGIIPRIKGYWKTMRAYQLRA